MYQEFDLDKVKGKVVTTKKLKVPAFQTIIAKGLTKVIRPQKHVHVLVEPSPNCKSIFVPGNTSELIPGGSSIAVVLRNTSGREVTLEPHTEVGIVTTANIGPSIQLPNEPDFGEDDKIQCMSPQADLSEGTSWRTTELGNILQKIDLSEIEGWNPQGAKRNSGFDM